LPRWYRCTPSGVGLEIELGLDRLGRDLWFVRIANTSAEVVERALTPALARVAGMEPDAPWIAEVGRDIERDRSVRI